MDASLVQQPTNSIPPCATACFRWETPPSSCSLADLVCFCGNASLAKAISECLEADCSTKEQLRTIKIQKDACGVEPHNEGRNISAVIWSLYVIALFCVFARLAARCSNLDRYAWDDWTVLACLAALTPATALNQSMIQEGLGRDLWNLTPGQVTNVLLYSFIGEYLYAFLVALTKISILCLYLRTFVARPFRMQCYVLIGVVLAFALGSWVLTSLRCRPISYTWEQWDGEHQGTCMENINKKTLALAGINMVLDILVFVLPMPQLPALQMSNNRKVGVILMFSIGLLVTACSIIRLPTILRFSNTKNPTLDYAHLAFLSLVEVDAGLICVCLPGLAQLVQRMWPRLLATVPPRDSDALSEHRLQDSRAPEEPPREPEKAAAPRFHKRSVTKTTSITVSFGHGDAAAATWESGSDDHEMLAYPRPNSSIVIQGDRAGGIEQSDGNNLDHYTPGAETRGYRTGW